MVSVPNMSETPRRRYQSARRQQNAAQTRSAIVIAARAQFVEHGWQGASMREIAREAGVAVETVYSNFSTKAALFKEVLNVLVVGDDQSIALRERPEFHAASVGPLHDRVYAMARLMAEVHGRVSRLRMVLREAARADLELAETERMVIAEEREQTRLGVAALGGNPLDHDVGGWQALYSSDVYALLTEVHGWTPERYIIWVAATTEAILSAKGVV
jgi:AcrR family transcriptional regulator